MKLTSFKPVTTFSVIMKCKAVISLFSSEYYAKVTRWTLTKSACFVFSEIRIQIIQTPLKGKVCHDRWDCLQLFCNEQQQILFQGK